MNKILQNNIISTVLEYGIMLVASILETLNETFDSLYLTYTTLKY